MLRAEESMNVCFYACMKVCVCVRRENMRFRLLLLGGL